MEAYQIILIVNAILGLILFEFSWYQMKPVRTENEARDS
jgi:hypothetical protein